MNHCLILYEPCGDAQYSLKGLALLSKNLKNLQNLPFSAEEQRREAILHAEKLSIQGVQPKLGARLNVRQGCFELSDTDSRFILKPQNRDFLQLPENEAVTMLMAAACGIETPVSGLVKSEDESLTYFIRRFDRLSKTQKLSVEDFAQLTHNNRERKYASSMERVAEVLEQFCSFPTIEKIKLFRLVLFNFLVGNEDAHLKNFSLITRNGKVELSPAYDLLNTTIALRGANIEEMALPLSGKKRKLTADLLIHYYGQDRLKLSGKSIEQVFSEIRKTSPIWMNLLEICFLNDDLKQKYRILLEKRLKILGLG